jgi:hypothetical protein
VKTYTIKPLEWMRPAWVIRLSTGYIEAKPIEGITYSVEEIDGNFQWLWGPPLQPAVDRWHKANQ